MKAHRIITLLLILTLLASIMEVESRLSQTIDFFAEKMKIEEPVPDTPELTIFQKASLLYNK
jgi:hypothetical protein